MAAGLSQPIIQGGVKFCPCKTWRLIWLDLEGFVIISTSIVFSVDLVEVVYDLAKVFRSDAVFLQDRLRFSEVSSKSRVVDEKALDTPTRRKGETR